MSDLDGNGQNGLLVQHKLVAEFAQMQRLNSKDLPDVEEAKAALQALKSLAGKSVVVTTHEREKVAERASKEVERLRHIENTNKRLVEAKKQYYALVSSTDNPASRGYCLENILQMLFEIEEIEYHPPFRTDTEQIDGYFKFHEDHFLLEARWRKQQPTSGDILAFQGKVRGKFSGTRGVFVSINSFRDEVVDSLGNSDKSVILMDGQDLIEVFEERMSLRDVLEQKILYASKYGKLFHPVY